MNQSYTPYLHQRTGLRLEVREHSDGWFHNAKAYRASFEVSIGNGSCMGDRFRCLCEWARERFGSFEVSLGDTLIAHNYRTVGHPKLGVLEPAAAFEEARADGDRWIESNSTTLKDGLPVGCRVVRWDNWKSHAKFEPTLAAIREGTTTDTAFDHSVRQDIAQYLARRKVEMASMSATAVSELTEYILEELAVYAIQAMERPTVNLYPGSPLTTLLNIRKFESLPLALRNREYCYVAIKAP